MSRKTLKTHPQSTEVVFRDAVYLPTSSGQRMHTYVYTDDSDKLEVVWNEGARIHISERVVWIPWDNIKFVDMPTPVNILWVETPTPDTEEKPKKIEIKVKGKKS